ncbi:RNA exonuclease 1 homolog [Geodia barretti]|uniref:RNA exonuclease 1 homolog n=1 Tax=Geodia barretti TaxID=519541 RepID=A0AA35S385_GEOBA|nr:RNA exonuclease 1 homolog [Geodia barretti]
MKRRPGKPVAKKDDIILPSSKPVFVPGPSREPLSPQTMEEVVAGEDIEGRVGRGGNEGDLDTELLKIDLFGESDSDCVALSSPCSSGEEEIMNVSFEDALRGTELGRGRRGKGLEGAKKIKVAQSGKRKVAPEKRERVGSGEMKEKGRQRLGSGEEKREVKRVKVPLTRRREQRRSSSNSVDEPPANFKPDSNLLVNLSDVAAAKVNSLTSSLLSLQQLSTGSAARGGARSSSSSSLLKPSCTVFKKAAVTLTAPVFYALMEAYLMTQEQLVENGYPMATEKVGVAAINWGGDPPPIIQPVGSNAMRHRCCRCGKNFIIYDDGKYQTVEECIHHYGRLFKVKEYGEGVVSQYSCCNERRDSGGCQVAKFHVTAGAKPREISGYVITSSSSTTNETVYAVDCEMCYTTAGLELTRVSVVTWSYSQCMRQLSYLRDPLWTITPGLAV